MDKDSQHKRKSTFPGLVFIPKNSAHGAAQLFHVVAHKVDNYNKGRKSFEMDYNLLQKGDVSETRFVLGKIILNTMGCGIDKDDENIHITPSDSTLWQPNVDVKKKLKKRNIVTEVKKIEDGCVIKQQQQKEAVSEQNVETVTGNETITKEESGKKKYKSKRVSSLSSLFK